MRKFNKITALVLAVMLCMASLTFFAHAENTALTVDASTISGTAGNSGEGLDKLFDGNTSSKYCTMNNQAEVVFALTAPASVGYYELVSADEPARDPKAWTLYGSADGESWTVIDAQADQDFIARSYANRYTVETPASYLWYKLEITANHGTDPWGYDILALAELALYEGAAPEEEDTDLHVVLTSVDGTAGNGSHGIVNLFDGNTATKYLVIRESSDDIVTVTFETNFAAPVNCYKFTSADDWDVRDPKEWVFYGSADGEDWEMLDYRSDEDLPARTTAYTYQFDNETPYSFFKFEFFANNGVDPFGNDAIQLSEIELLVAEGEIVDDSIIVLTNSITSSTPYNDSHTPDKLFDNDTGSKFLTNGTSMFVQFSLKSAKAVNAYTITCANDWASRSPSAWTFYGSADGENWVALDSRDGETPSGLQKGDRYVFENNTPYLWYKLDVTKNNGQTITGFAELTLEVTEDPALYTKLLAIDASSVTAPAGSSGNGVGNLTDDNASTRYLVNSGSIEVSFSLVKPAVVNRYTIAHSKDHLERSPKTFALYGSVDGEEWVELDRQDLEAKTAKDPNFFCGETFTFENNVVYTYYKLVVEAVSSGSYTGMSKLNVFTASPAQGLDVYAPANVTDLTGVAAASKVKTLTVKALTVDAASAEALDAQGPVTVYRNVPAEGDDAVAAAFEGKTNVTVKNILDASADVVTEVKDGKNVVTAIGVIKVDDVDYESLGMKVSFYQDGVLVKEKTASIYAVYTTVNGYASVSETIAEAQGLQTVEGTYLAAVSVKGVPSGSYDVTVTLFGTVAGADGNVEVIGESATASVNF